MRRILATAVVLVAGWAAAMDNPLPQIPHETYRLDNGLTVVLVEDHSVPLVAVNVNYQVGSKNEKPGRTGFAHLFEHMMFQGSEHFNDDFFKALQDIGGAVNGGTNTDRTRYWELVPAAYAERALWLEADRMGFLLEATTQDRLENQISVVQNERRQRYENAPYGTVYEKMQEVLYPPNHPYSWTTIGSMADLQAATLDDVKQFFRSYYTPNNASLVVAGDFDPAEMKKLVERHFGAIPPGPPVSKLGAWQPQLDSDVVLEVQDRVQLPRIYIAVPTAPAFSADDAALDVFGRILGGGKTSRLYKALVYEQQIAQDAVAFNSSSEIAGSFRMVLSPRPGHDLTELQAAADEVLAEALDKGITADELERTQTAITSEFVNQMQSIGGFYGVSDEMNRYVHYLGKPDMFRWDLQRYLDLTPESVTATAQRYLRRPRLTANVRPLARVAPSTSDEATTVDRSKMPGPGSEHALTIPERHHFTLENGLEVVLVEQHKLPTVAMQLVVRGGSAADPAGLAGLASLTAALMQEGAGGRSAAELADAIEAAGADVSVNAGDDAVYASLKTLKPRLQESLRLFNDVVTHPDLPKAELERQRARRLVRFAQLEDVPEYLAQVALQRVLYGDHPYGHLSFGSRTGIEAATLDDVKGYWQTWFVPSNATLVVVGDVTRPELEAAFGDTLASWKGGHAPALDLATPPQHGPRTVYIVDKPGAAQSVIAAGQVGVARSTPDHAALEVLSMALGGQFVSRLNLNLREDKGYTYGARCGFQYSSAPGIFSATTPVDSKVTAAAVNEVVREISDVVGTRPLTDEEVAYARGAIVNGYPRRFETPAQIARQLAEVELYGLPADSLEAFPVAVEGITPTAANQAAHRILEPSHLAVVVVGDAAAIRSDLEALDLGPVVVLDHEGRPQS